MPGKGGWCVSVGAVGALVEYVVGEGGWVIGLVKMKVDFAASDFLVGRGW